jgi:hypothetical protein
MRPMTGPGQERRIGALRNISALPPRADVGADVVEPPVSATKRHMQCSKFTLFDHLVSDGKQRRRQLDPERHRGF